MNLEVKSTERIVAIVSVVLILIVFSLIGYHIYDPEFDVFSSLSGVAAIAVAYLTVAYVLTTSQQLNVMRQQLAEMKKSRELVDQPLPTIKTNNIHLQKPRFFYTPPTEKYSWQSLMQLEITIQNISNYPAVNVCIYPIVFVEEGEQKFSLTEDANFFEILGQDSITKKFIFTEDKEGEILRSLTNRYKPKLLVKILYKNILGAPFLSEHHFDLRVGHFKSLGMEEYKKKNELIGQWYKKIKSFSNDFKNELMAINSLTPHKSQEWRAQFDAIKERFANSIEGDENFKLEAIVNSSKYKISVIDNQLYNDEVEARKDQ